MSLSLSSTIARDYWWWCFFVFADVLHMFFVTDSLYNSLIFIADLFWQARRLNSFEKNAVLRWCWQDSADTTIDAVFIRIRRCSLRFAIVWWASLFFQSFFKCIPSSNSMQSCTSNEWVSLWPWKWREHAYSTMQFYIYSFEQQRQFVSVRLFFSSRAHLSFDWLTARSTDNNLNSVKMASRLSLARSSIDDIHKECRFYAVVTERQDEGKRPRRYRSCGVARLFISKMTIIVQANTRTRGQIHVRNVEYRTRASMPTAQVCTSSRRRRSTTLANHHRANRTIYLPIVRSSTTLQMFVWVNIDDDDLVRGSTNGLCCRIFSLFVAFSHSTTMASLFANIDHHHHRWCLPLSPRRLSTDTWWQ